MNYIIIVFAFSVLLAFTNRLSYINGNYAKVFGTEYQWIDFWQENIRIFRGVELILNSLIILLLWIISKDFLGTSIFFLMIVVLLVYAVLCVMAAYNNAKSSDGFFNACLVMVEDFFHLFFALPMDFVMDYFFDQLDEDFTATVISWTIYLGTLTHVLINPFID